MMKAAYCSLLLPEDKRLSERSRERLSGISIHKVASAEIAGIDQNNDRPLDVFNIINTVNYPKFPQLLFRKEVWNHTSIQGHTDYHLGYVNLLGIKYVTQYLSLKKALLSWVRESSERVMICVHHIYLPAMWAAVSVAHKYPDKVRICLNSGDVPGRYGLVSQFHKNLKQVLTEQLVDRNIIRLARKFDCYVFVTGAMAEAFGVADKPYVVVECAYIRPGYTREVEVSVAGKGVMNAADMVTGFPQDVAVQEEAVIEEKRIFYAGAIREEYGIGHLLRAFSMIKGDEYRLLIAGGGAGEGIVKEYADKDPRIIYLGFITPQEVLRNQLEAKVLVSPRQADREYVKYSFPSKAVDCLATGIPYVAHRLPCDPPEYEGYINYTADESDESLRDKMMEICELPLEEWMKIGDRARKFIETEKNPQKMTRRVVEMWEDVLRA